MRSAVELFEARGFEQTTTAMIAAAGGVSEMTFFRHFGSKDGVLFDDPYDPMIVKAVAQQSSELPAIRRVSEGLRAAWSQISLPKAALVRRRIQPSGHRRAGVSCAEFALPSDELVYNERIAGGSQGVLGSEVMDHQPGTDAGFRGDIAHRDAVEPVATEQQNRGVADPRAGREVLLH